MQKIFTLEPNGLNGKWSTVLLEAELRDDWRIVEATPIMKNVSQVSATVAILYVLEKEDED